MAKFDPFLSLDCARVEVYLATLAMAAFLAITDRVCPFAHSLSYLIIGFNSPHDDGEAKRNIALRFSRFVVRAKAAHICRMKLGVRGNFRPKIGTVNLKLAQSI